MFGLLDDAIDLVRDVTEEVVDLGSEVVSLGSFGALSKENVKVALGTGLTVYELSDMTGVAVSVLEGLTDD